MRNSYRLRHRFEISVVLQPQRRDSHSLSVFDHAIDNDELARLAAKDSMALHLLLGQETKEAVARRLGDLLCGSSVQRASNENRRRDDK